MKHFIRTMKALSDPSRVRMLKLLASKELCVCEMVELVGLAQSTVSKHLRQLEEAELVTASRAGQWIVYRLNHTPANNHAAALLNHLQHHLQDDEQLLTMHARLPHIDRRNLCREVEEESGS